MPQQHLFNKIFSDISQSNDLGPALQSIVEEHPYFGLAHFYSLKNTAKDSTLYAEKVAQTALFFTSPFYLQAQLNTDEILDNQQREILTSNTDKIDDKEEIEIATEKIEEELLFQPLHASDYFASQGIKLSENALATDKLGKQLKSFTAWLKTMKKVNTDKLPIVSAIAETAVKTQAEKSNVEEEIVTEPMAEAYILQNKTLKAIDIYNKLSLLNPTKSAYFAAKIDSLKL